MSTQILVVEGSTMLQDIFKQISKYKPKDFCQFQTILTFALLSKMLVSSKKIKGGHKRKRKTIKGSNKKRRTRKRGGNGVNNESVTQHLLQLFSSIGSFQNYFGTCMINSLVVVQAIDSNDTEEMFYAYLPKLSKQKYTGLENFEITRILNPEATLDWKIYWILHTFENHPKIIAILSFIESKLIEICTTRNMPSLITILNYYTGDKDFHSIVVWYTESKNIVFIDLQVSVNKTKMVLYCTKCKDEYLLSKGFHLEPISNYISNNFRMEPGLKLEIYQSAIYQVQNFFKDDMPSFADNAELEALLERDAQLQEIDSVFGPDKDEVPRGKLKVVDAINKTYEQNRKAMKNYQRAQLELKETIDESSLETIKFLVWKLFSLGEELVINPDKLELYAQADDIKKQMLEEAQKFDLAARKKLRNKISNYSSNLNALLDLAKKSNEIEKSLQTKYNREIENVEMNKRESYQANNAFNQVIQQVENRKRSAFAESEGSKRFKSDEEGEGEEKKEYVSEFLKP